MHHKGHIFVTSGAGYRMPGKLENRGIIIGDVFRSQKLSAKRNECIQMPHLIRHKRVTIEDPYIQNILYFKELTLVFKDCYLFM